LCVSAKLEQTLSNSCKPLAEGAKITISSANKK